MKTWKLNMGIIQLIKYGGGLDEKRGWKENGK